MKRQDDLLEGTRVIVPEEVVDEGGVLSNGSRAGTVRNACRLDDAIIATEVVDETHESEVVS
jgi:hypothetical protein